MGVRSRLLLDQATFTASTDTMNIPADNVDHLKIGVGALQNGTTAPTLAAIYGVLGEVLVDLGGHQICKIRADDLIAYNILGVTKHWHNVPWFRLGGGDNYLAGMGGLMLPLHITKNGRSLLHQITYGTAITNGDNQTLSVEYVYQDNRFPLHFAYQYESKAAAANTQWLGLARQGAAIQGILVYQPWTSIDDSPAVPDISEIEVVVDDRTVFSRNIFTSQFMHSPFNTTDGSSNGWAGKVDAPGPMYTYIDFENESWSADDLQILTKNTCGAYTGGSTNTCRLIGIYNER